jgi:hypothetical protein
LVLPRLAELGWMDLRNGFEDLGGEFGADGG